VTVETARGRTRVWINGRLVYDSAEPAPGNLPGGRGWWGRLRRRSEAVDTSHVSALLERAMTDIRAGWPEAALDALGRAQRLIGGGQPPASSTAP
jgi:hypothetical protein